MNKQKLLDIKTSEELFELISNYWSENVISSFKIDFNYNQEFLDTNVEETLTKPLHFYLFQTESDESLIKLAELDNDEPKVCGKILKTNEKIYFCQDCSNDITRIMCNDCFRHSKHRYHRYKIITSDGNGYCDCGDLDAWKQYPHCDKHKSANLDKQFSVDDTINKLPGDLVQRLETLAQVIFDYILQIISLEEEQTNPVPEHFAKSNNTDDYVLYIYLNELANSGELTNALAYTLRLNYELAIQYAELLGRHGRLAVKQGTLNECLTHKNWVNNRKNTDHIAKYSIVHSELVAHQFFVDKLFCWLKKICQYSKSICYLLCKILFSKQSIDTPTQPLILKFLQRNFFIWQNAREKMYEFIVTNILMDQYWKREFAVIFAQNYKAFMRSYLINKNFATITTLNLCVQIFPVATLSSMLLDKCNLFEIIMQTFIEITNLNDEDDSLEFLSISDKHRPDYYLAKFIMNDLSYLLTNKPDEWSTDLRQNFLNGFKLYVDLIKHLQSLNSVIRFTKAHIEFEPEWEKSYYFLSRLQKPTNFLLDWLLSDRHVLIESLKILFNTLNELDDLQELLSMKQLTYSNKVYEIISYDILVKQVSLHAHFTRLFANVYLLCSKFEPIYASVNANLVSNKNLVFTLVEPSIRAFVLFAQASKCGLWKRNGSAFLNQVYLYNNIMFRNEFLDRDILCMQMGSILLDSDEFLIILLERFKLFNYLTNVEYNSGREESDSELAEILNPMCECFLELLIFLICERYDANLSKLRKDNEKLEREVLHILCIEPACFSNISGHIYRDLEHYTNDIDLTEVLNKIANTKHSNNSKTIYELKEEYYDYYNPYFYHYTNAERTKAEDNQLNLRKNDKTKLIKPTKLPQLRAAFTNLKHLLDSDVFMNIVHCILDRYLSSKSNQNYESHLIKILYLIGLALHEEYDETSDFNNNHHLVDSNFEFKFIEKSLNFKLQSNFIKHYLNEIISLPQLKDTYTRHLTEWTLNYYNDIVKMKYHMANDNQQVSHTPEVVVSEKLNSDKELAKLKAEKRRAKLLNKFNQMQTEFVNKNQDLESSIRKSFSQNDELVSVSNAILDEKNSIYLLGSRENLGACLVNGPKKVYHCILCQEDAELSELNDGTSPMILPCYLQNSRVLSKIREQTDVNDILFKRRQSVNGPYTSTCGHSMHADCWFKYIANLNTRRTLLSREELNENWCPLCETICNSALTVFPGQASSELFKSVPDTKNTYEEWFDQMKNKHRNNLELEDYLKALDLNEERNSFKLNAQSLNLVDCFNMNSFNFGSNMANLKLNNKTLNEKACLSIMSNCSYTLQVTEQLLSLDEQSSHHTKLTLKQENLLSNLIKQALATSDIQNELNEMRKNVRTLYSYLFDEGNLELNSEISPYVPLADVDVFHYLVSLTLLTNKNKLEQFYLFKLMLQLQALQIVFNYLITNKSTAYDESSLLVKHLIERLKEKSFAHQEEESSKQRSIDLNMLISSLKQALMPFLRCCVLFYWFQSNVTQSCEVSSYISDNLSDFTHMITSLGLTEPEFEDLVSNVNNPSLIYLIDRMIKTGVDVNQKLEFPFRLNELIKLPEDYVDLIAMSTCSNDVEPKNMICLLCGEMFVKRPNMATSVKHEILNKSVGECTAHTFHCGANVGMFLKIDECKVLLLQIKFLNTKNNETTFDCRGCTIPAPYLDSYGETDQNFTKGNPLFLSPNLYKKLFLEWITHSIPFRVFSHNQSRLTNIDMSFF